jgi:hypothetical protein
MFQGHGRTSLPLPRGSKSPEQRCWLCYTACFELSSLAWAPPCCNVVRLCCDLEVCNLETATTVALLSTLYRLIPAFENHAHNSLTNWLTEWSRVLLEKLIAPSTNQEILILLWNKKVQYCSRIWGSHGGEYEDGCLLGCSAVQFGRSLLLNF